MNKSNVQSFHKSIVITYYESKSGEPKNFGQTN